MRDRRARHDRPRPDQSPAPRRLRPRPMARARAPVRSAYDFEIVKPVTQRYCLPLYSVTHELDGDLVLGAKRREQELDAGVRQLAAFALQAAPAVVPGRLVALEPDRAVEQLVARVARLEDHELVRSTSSARYRRGRPRPRPPERERGGGYACPDIVSAPAAAQHDREAEREQRALGSRTVARAAAAPAITCAGWPAHALAGRLLEAVEVHRAAVGDTGMQVWLHSICPSSAVPRTRQLAVLLVGAGVAGLADGRIPQATPRSSQRWPAAHVSADVHGAPLVTRTGALGGDLPMSSFALTTMSMHSVGDVGGNRQRVARLGLAVRAEGGATRRAHCMPLSHSSSLSMPRCGGRGRDHRGAAGDRRALAPGSSA